MPTSFLDSFQFIVALYLLYVAAKGSGQMYRFFDLTQSDQKKVHKPLRLIYLTAGLIALAETAVCMLQNAMFTQNMTDAGMTVTQNFVIESLPFLTYPMLSSVSSVLTILVITILIGTFVWLRRLSARCNNKKD